MSLIVLYVASTEDRAADGAAALGGAATDLVVEPAVSLESIRTRAPASDCVVFAETPTTAAGENLLDVIEACGSTPLVLYSEESFGAATARSTDGVDGYVRQGDDATHLADEIRWVCKGATDDSGPTEDDRVMDTLLDALREVTDAGPIDDLCRESLTVARSIVGFDWGGIYVGSQTGLSARVTIGDRLSPAGADDPSLRALASTVVERGSACTMEDIVEHSSVSPEAVDLRSSVGAPIGRGGALVVVRDEPGGFSAAAVDAILVVAAVLARSIEKRRATTELTSTQAELETLFDAVPDPTVRFSARDHGVVIEDVNDAFESFFGFESNAVVGEPIDDVLAPTGLDVQDIDIEDALDRGTVEVIETRRQTTDEVRDFEVTVVPVREIGGGFSIYRDVTQHRRRERKIAAQRERIDEIGELVDTLRDPLNLASAYTDVAERTGDTDHYDDVKEAISWMGEIIETLVFMTTELEVIIATEPVALHDIANRAWSTIDTEQATLEFGRDLLIEADKTRLVDAFEALFGNAIKHGAADQPITITVGTTASGFYVEDDGVGIQSEDYDRIFEPGYTTAGDGTGYGLSLVDRVAEAHGWTITVTSSATAGARFEFAGVTVPDTVERTPPHEARR